jgi:hypothetical protein
MAVANSFDKLILRKNFQGINMKISPLKPECYDFSFSNFISRKLINYLCEECERFRVFDPSSTLFCFLFQVINSCSAKSTLLNFNIQRSMNNLKLVSMNTAAYTVAKKRLCEEKLKYIARKIGEDIDNKSSCWRFKDRDVFLGDGTVINLEDTQSIKKEFPINLRRGVQQGLPKMRLLCFFSASSGAFIDGEIGSYCGKGQAETSLLRKMLSRIRPKSILVLDRFFTSFDLRELIINDEKEYVIRSRDKIAKLYLKRRSDIQINELPFRGKKGLIPIKSRYIKSTIKRAGFRTAKIYIVTSLLNEDGFTKQDIELLYLKRWGVELDIRNLKQTLAATQLRSKSSIMAKKELWVHLIAYNLVKKMSNMNCHLNFKEPRKQCFKLYVESLKKVFSGDHHMIENVLYQITSSETLNSKYRREARALRRYRKTYEVMNMSRDQARKQKWGKSGRLDRQGLQRAEAA